MVPTDHQYDDFKYMVAILRQILNFIVNYALKFIKFLCITENVMNNIFCNHDVGVRPSRLSEAGR